MNWDHFWTSLAASLPALLAALAAFIQGLRNAKTTKDVKDGVDQVHIVANSNFTQQAELLRAANEKIVALEKRISVLLAAATPPPPPVPMPPILKEQQT